MLIASLFGHGYAWAMPEPVPLRLEIYLNGHPTHLIAAFVQLPDERIAIERAELRELYIKAPAQAAGIGPVLLNDIPGLIYHYIPEQQSIQIVLPESGFLPRVFDARKKGDVPEAQSSVGAVLNYGLTGSVNNDTSCRILYC